MTDVNQPPPSANCGKSTTDDDTDDDRSTTGRVDIKKSPRSLTNVRSAIAVTGTDELKVKVPSMELPPLNGISFKNLAICRPAGITVLPDPNTCPVVSAKEKF